MRARFPGLVMAILIVVFVARAGRAQQCEDGNPCTTNDMCTNGQCVGTPVDSGACDDFNDCTINDRCLPGNSGCRGDPAPAGSTCAGGCGTCLPVLPGPGALTICIANAGSDGTACNPGGVNPCFEGRCRLLPSNTTICLPRLKQCPDTDGNPCTDNCNLATGRCEHDAPKCIPECESCDPSNGACQPANLGAACDDHNPCTPASRCERSTGGGEIHGLCLLGVPLVGTPTATQQVATSTATASATVAAATATASATVAAATATAPPRLCAGDCNGDGVIAVNEVIIGVNISLGTAPVSRCPALDGDANGIVQVNELIAAVRSLLNGCA
jgi:hypothetical protein